MTVEAFNRWIADRNISKLEAARQLGLNKNTVTKYCREGGPLWLGLACAAISQGLKPWGGE